MTACFRNLVNQSIAMEIQVHRFKKDCGGPTCIFIAKIQLNTVGGKIQNLQLYPCDMSCCFFSEVGPIYHFLSRVAIQCLYRILFSPFCSYFKNEGQF